MELLSPPDVAHSRPLTPHSDRALLVAVVGGDPVASVVQSRLLADALRAAGILAVHVASPEAEGDVSSLGSALHDLPAGGVAVIDDFPGGPTIDVTSPTRRRFSLFRRGRRPGPTPDLVCFVAPNAGLMPAERFFDAETEYQAAFTAAYCARPDAATFVVATAGATARETAAAVWATVSPLLLGR